MKLDEVLKVFRVFSERTRLRIYLALLEAELCVGELMALLKLEQSLLSHQLRILRQAGLIEARKSGRRVFYRPAADHRKQLEPLLSGLFKEEFEMTSRKVKSIKEKNVCRLAGKKEKELPPRSARTRAVDSARRKA
ncbi:MAG: metalloregulator ArsR/SmtB family transcription factor [Candidatus Saccharicenans sp.]|nr:metalloregulator ArsR/SmtB family transcription factor [Candidatus Saccharicenans sp.]